MLKVIKYSEDRKTATLKYDNRDDITLYSSSGNIYSMVDEWLAPIGAVSRTLTEYNSTLEDTAVIELKEVA
jgi:hypothetical protein